MKKRKWLVSVLLVAELSVVSWSVKAQTNEPRLALVIGNAQYHSGPLATTSNDAGLIAQTLTTAGFDVTGAADLDQDSMRGAFKEFLAKVQAAGPHAISFVYLAGYGLQYGGENYFIPVDASLQRDTDIPIEAIRVSDLTHALSGLPLDARIFVLDAARANPFPVKGNPLAGGLALVDAEEGALIAFNAAPGTIAPPEQGPYGIYARALAEMLRYGGVPIDEAFARARLRSNELSHGALVPWDASKLTHPIVLLAANPDAEALPPTQSYGALQSRAIRDFPTAAEAYAAAIEVDTLASYQAFLQIYPSDPLAYRVRALLAARREALTWNRTFLANTPDAYWSYMRRYPRGPHFYDARRRLAGFSVSLEPPPRFDPYDFQGLPPPPEEEYIIVDRPEIIFEGPDYAPAPPPPPHFLAPPPPEFRRLPPPPEPRAIGALPAPEAIPLPFARPPARPGSFSQPNLPPQGGPGHQPPGGGHPGAQAPNAQAPNVSPQAPAGGGAGQPAPAVQPDHALPAAPQGGPGAPAPQGEPVHPHGEAPHQSPAGEPGPAQPNHALPVPPQGATGAATLPGGPAHPHGEPQHQPAGEPAPAHPNAQAPNAAPAGGGAGQPAPAVTPQAHPDHVAPPTPPAPAPHVEPVHPAAPPAAAPHVEPPHPAPPAPVPHVEPPHPAPPPAAAPHVEPPPHPVPLPVPAPAAPHPAPPPAAAAPPHPPVPPHPPKPGEKEEKPGEQH